MYRYFFKRFTDILISLILIPLILIIIFFVSIMIFIFDRGPIFYISERLGKNGKIFKMIKIRTMKVDSDDIRNEDGSTFNSENDPRVSNIGSFLRKSSIDELPQIFNVLIGNMSLIGPRPDLPDQIKLYTKNEKRKLNIKPGITGYNQAFFRNSISWKNRILNDIYYSENVSLRLDLKIFLKTIIVVLGKKNVYSEKVKKDDKK